jgi:hypothetical protein
VGATNLCKRLPRVLPRNPDELRKIASKCRSLAETCVTQAARRPLFDMAEEFEREAEAQQHMRQPIGSGRY